MPHRTIRPQPRSAASDERLPPPLRTATVVYFADFDRRTWSVQEADCTHLADARGPRCLHFESDGGARRVFDYPSDWALLSTEALIALGASR
jgi:hypothetical protein